MNTRLVSHEQLTLVQRQQLLDIEVHPAQKDFSGDIHGALATLLDRPGADIRGFALLHDEVPRAFLLLKRGAFLAPWADRDAATLHALQVDRRLQRQGLGRQCLAQLPQAARQLWPDIAQLQLSVDAENQAGLGLYLALGWVDSGEAYRGRIGYERRLSLRLR
jgi:ribosomal protein S18 acetylase RimI-like enzyme